VFGALADRKGYKLVLELGVLLAAASILMALVAPSPDWFYGVFLLRGASLAALFLSMMFVMEFSIPSVRPTYLGLNNTFSGAVNGIAPLLGGVVASIFGYPVLFAMALVLLIASFGLLRWFVRDPRHTGLPPAGEVAK
jgi:MFS family permease